METKDLYDDPTVRKWSTSAGFDEEPEREQLARLDLLRSYCDFAGTTPTQMIEACLIADADAAVGGQREISIKGRREMNQSIDDWAQTLPGTGFMRTIAGNSIRGFLVHNGILIQGRPFL